MTDTVKHPDGGNQLQIGEHFYDPVSNELLDPSGNTVRLRPQSGQVLAVLARHSGTVITKSELFAAVWPNTSVTDDSLTQCISEIRKSLGDSDRKLLRTIPKQGYLLDSRSVVLSSTTQKTLPHHISADLIEWEATRQRTVMIICRPAGGPDETSLYDAVQSVVRLHRPTGAKAIDGNSATLTFATPIEALRCSRALNRSAGALGIGVLRTAFDTLERSRIAALSKLLRVSNDGREYATVEVRDQLHFSLECEFEDLGDQHQLAEVDGIRLYRVHRYGSTYYPAARTNLDDVLPTVAVLPFTIRNRSAHDPVLANVLVDDIISALSQSTDLNVISRLSTFGIRTENMTLELCKKTFNAEFLMSGVCDEDGARVIVTLELTDVSSGKILWSERILKPLESWINNLSVIDEIVMSVRKAISLNEVRKSRLQPITSLKNSTLLLGAVALMHRLSKSDFQAARVMLDELMDRTPDHPLVLSWVARWYVLQVQQGWTETPENDGQSALQYTSRALEIDPECALGLISEGAVLVNLFRDLELAQDRYNTALEVNPNDANGRLLRGTLYAFQGQGDLAVSDTELAMHLAPLDPHRFMFLALSAGASLAADNLPRTVELAEASLRLNRSHASTLRIKAVAQLRLGRESDARKTTRELLRVQPNLTVDGWLKRSPSSSYQVGLRFAETLKDLGIPET
ncbi:winged helix-turn-helix domain-containing tetratricopeptide repeat protein [Phaeobacter inhibens]|uniref:winged helix-turn-helix domain-containing tetratricopeptide repeat protein n=1 Tax=Phaeobacter inhibens TaxID=221822 RepID=UPI000402521C|nr:winged helix-turn-helix domain-containing protein [Phaeobacter inhibens]